MKENLSNPHGPMPEWGRDGRYPFSLDGDIQLTGEGYVTDRDLSGVLAGETRESVKRFLDKPGMSNRVAFAAWLGSQEGANYWKTIKQRLLSEHGIDDLQTTGNIL